MGTRTVILGGGTGGVVAANVLRRSLPDEHQVILISEKAFHIYYAGLPFMAVGQRLPEAITRPLAGLERKNIKFAQARIEAVDPDQSRVETSLGPVEYDYLVVSLGAEHHPETVPGFVEGAMNYYSLDGAAQIWRNLRTFDRGRIVIFISSLPYICPPAPYELTFLIDDLLRHRGVRHQVDLCLVTPEPYPESLGGPLAGRPITDLLGDRGINYRAGVRILSLDPNEGVLHMDHNLTEEADLFIGVPPHWGPGIFRGTEMADPTGWIEVHPTTLAAGYGNIWAVGDCTNIRVPVTGDFATKAGIMAHFQAEVVARNIAALINKLRPRYRYRAKGG